MRVVEVGLEGPHRLHPYARLCGLKPLGRSRRFKDLAGFGFYDYVGRVRVLHALDLFATAGATIDVVAQGAFFESAQDLREAHQWVFDQRFTYIAAMLCP